MAHRLINRYPYRHYSRAFPHWGRYFLHPRNIPLKTMAFGVSIMNRGCEKTCAMVNTCWWLMDIIGYYGHPCHSCHISWVYRYFFPQSKNYSRIDETILWWEHKVFHPQLIRINHGEYEINVRYKDLETIVLCVFTMYIYMYIYIYVYIYICYNIIHINMYYWLLLYVVYSISYII